MSATSVLIQPLQRTHYLQPHKPRPRAASGHTYRLDAPSVGPTMPLLTRESLAHRFRQNWLAKHPLDAPTSGGVPLDDSLTSLNWLQNLNIMKMTTPTPPASPEPQQQQQQLSKLGGSDALSRSYDMRVDPNAVLNMTNVPVLKTEGATTGSASTITTHTGLSPLNCKLTAADVAPPTPTTPTMDKIDYKSNPYVKPPYSYATLICMAMRESKKNKITLSGIYNWITENFMYYRVADPSWQNSIRHNLSLNKCFQKVPRRKDEPGKGGFWRINPEYSDMFVNGIFKKRRSTARETLTSPPTKRLKREPDDDLLVSARNPSLAPSALGIDDEVGALRLAAAAADAAAAASIENDSEDSRSSGDALRGDFNWNAILQQDIEVDGVMIKTEDIIDGKRLPLSAANRDSNSISGLFNGCSVTPEDEAAAAADSIACPITTLSPPPSESSSDLGLDELLGTTESAGGNGSTGYDDPVDLSCGSAIDLTIQGNGIRPPDWWSESLNKDLMQRVFLSPDEPCGGISQDNNSGLHTPLATTPTRDDADTSYAHPWAESRADLDEAIASFDLDLQNLFDEDLTGGSVLSDS